MRPKGVHPQNHRQLLVFRHRPERQTQTTTRQEDVEPNNDQNRRRGDEDPARGDPEHAEVVSPEPERRVPDALNHQRPVADHEEDRVQHPARREKRQRQEDHAPAPPCQRQRQDEVEARPEETREHDRHGQGEVGVDAEEVDDRESEEGTHVRYAHVGEVREPLSREREREAHAQDGDDEPLKNHPPQIQSPVTPPDPRNP